MGLIEESRRLAPEFAATANQDDALGRLSDRTWKGLLEGGFLRALPPARFGGGEVASMQQRAQLFLVPDPLARSVGGSLLGTTKPEMVL